MAYSIRAIDITDQYTWLSSLKTILDELDVDYFDSTVLAVDKTSSPIINELDIKKGDRVICKISIPNALTSSSGNKVFFYPLEGSSNDTTLSGLSSATSVVITDNSIAIIFGVKGIIFTKTQTHKNALIGYNVASSNQPAMTYEDTIVSTYTKYENKTGILTQILPVLLGSPEGEYSPYVCFAVRTQSAESNSFKQIALNNKNFLTNGNLCLEI